jgi:nucleoside-diphosphate-sugar epimerase
VVDETTTPRPSDPTSVVLLEAESARPGPVGTRCSLREFVRCSGLYGPARLGTIERVRSGALALGDGDDAWMNFIHRDDAASLIIAALDRGRPGAIYHASDAHPVQRREVVAWIAAKLGIEPHRADPGGAPPGRRGANRRVSAEASCRELGVRLAYPSFKEGFAPYLV